MYRVDFKELDGKMVKSPVRSVATHLFEKNITVVNPMSSTLTMDILNPIDQLTIAMYDMGGRLIWSGLEPQATGRMEMPIDGLIPGQYLLTLNWPEGSENLLVQVIQ